MDRAATRSFLAAALVLLAAATAPTSAPAEDGAAADRRLQSMQGHILRLREELRDLAGRERGVLGELEKLGAELRLRRAQLQEVDYRLAEVRGGIRERTERLEDLDSTQDDRRTYLSFRLREMYKQGPARTVRHAMSGKDVENFLGGLRYAAFLSSRDARVLRDYRNDEIVLRRERESLLREKRSLTMVREESVAAGRALQRSREARSNVLEAVRRDKTQRQQALQELQAASAELSGLVESFEGDGDAATVDIRKFRGLLDLPVNGEITARFGKRVHPRFKTVVPHPGLDIEAEEGTPFRAIFEGRVAYATWLRGYGLTVILDHGSGLVSVYAHASVLLVEEGEAIVRGQRLGMVGETGSLKGPFLYFELRKDGQPVDPHPWFR